MNEHSSPFEDMEVISSYSRAQAIEDGVLVDVSALAREAGLKYDVAVSSGVFAVLAPWAWANGSQDDVSEPAEGQPLYGLGQSFNGRAWDLLTVLLYEIRRGQGGDRVDFAPLFLLHKRPGFEHIPPPRDGWGPAPIKMYAVCGPGDNAEPVITVMLFPGED